MVQPKSSAILFELLRSFSALARTLNLSRAVRQLGSTRQTVRRHIGILERRMGKKLFTLEDRQYHLTKEGRNSLREAEELLARGEAWLNDQSGHIGGLFHLASDGEVGPVYYLQQHPLGTLWRSGSKLLQQGFQCWANAKGKIESPEFAEIRPYLMIFRKLEDDWICTEVGEKSSYASWYGWRWERSSVGRNAPDLPGGPGIANLLAQPFHDVCNTEAVRYDHIHTQLERDKGCEKVPLSFQRLLLGCRFPDESFALAVLVNRTRDIEIAGLNPDIAASMPADLIMKIN